MSDGFSRRRFVAGAAAAGSTLGLRTARPADESPLGLAALTATEAVAGLRRGDFSAEVYAAALLRQCQSGAHLNAFITLRPEQVLEAARDCDRKRRAGASLGRLHGLPIPIKDSVNTRDLPTTAGTAALRHFQPKEDAPLVRTLRSAGAIVLGKTNLHELSYGYTSNNHVFGAIHNPYDPKHIPGGSSGGTAAAVAYRMAPLGIAEDTEGSIRVPAALCGIKGFRPTTGRYPTIGCVPITPLFDQLGPHARSVADLLLFDSVMKGVPGNVLPPRRPSLKSVRLGVIRSFFYSGLDAEVERITEAALGRLQNAGAELVEGELPDLPRLIALTCDPIQNHDVKPSLTRYLAEYHTGITFDMLLAQMSPDVRALIDPAITPGGSDFVPDDRYERIVKIHWPALRAMYRDYFARSGVAAVVFPATILAAPPIGEENM
jgi:indoleacetamide hydrolase